MRKLQFLFFMLFAFSAFSMAQTIENFESIKMNGFDVGANGMISVVPNPDATGANTSKYVGKMVRGKDGQPWAGWYASIPGADITANKYVHVKVWKPRISPTVFKLEAGPENSGDVYPIADQTLVGEWEELVFKYDTLAGEYKTIVLIPDFESPLTLTEDITLYFDDIYTNNDPAVGSAPVQILENFESITLNYMGGGAEDLSTFAVVANPDKSGVNISETVLEFKRDKDGVPWGGFWSALPTAIDVTDNKFVHVKVWKSRISPVKFKIEGGTAGTVERASMYPQTITNGWEDMVFDFRDKTGTYPTIAFMPDFEDPLTLTEDITLYIDDIRINNDSTSLLPPVQVFNVDMTKAGLTPGQNVWISGTLGGIYGSWNEPSTNANNQMLDPDGDGIYSITVHLADGPIEYKFFKGDNWNNGDSYSVNRTYTVAGSAVINCRWGVKGEVTPMVYAPTTNSVKATADVVVDGLKPQLM